MTGKQTEQEMQEQYAKLLVIVMRKYRLPHIVLTSQDVIEARRGGLNIVVQELDDGLHLRSVTDNEAKAFKKLEGMMNPRI